MLTKSPELLVDTLPLRALQAAGVRWILRKAPDIGVEQTLTKPPELLVDTLPLQCIISSCEMHCSQQT